MGLVPCLQRVVDSADVIGEDYPYETFRVSKTTKSANSVNTAPAAWCWRRGAVWIMSPRIKERSC